MKFYIFLFLFVVLYSCGSKESKPIRLNVDHCEYCKMTISNGKFGAELITQKGRTYKFDDLACMIEFAKAGKSPQNTFYVNDYAQKNTLIPAETAFFLKGDNIKSPMNGNYAAFSSAAAQEDFQTKLGATKLTWQELYTAYK